MAPGQPGSSYLINKLTGSGICGGSPMPPGGHLPDAAIATITAWICAVVSVLAAVVATVALRHARVGGE